MYSLGAGHLLTVGGGGAGELFWESLEDFQNNLQFILATIDKIAYLESIFLNIVNVTMAILPSPLEAVLLCLQKKAWSLSFCRKEL